MTRRSRIGVLLAATLTLVLIGAGYTWYTANQRGNAETTTDGLTLSAPGHLIYRDTSDTDRLVSVPATDPSGARTATNVHCLRFHAAAGTGLCLRIQPGQMPPYWAIVLDDHLNETRRLPVAGTPSRARVAPSGRMAAWTLFVGGHAYATAGSFSTQTSILDTRTGTLIDNLETFDITLDGKHYTDGDINIWGVTFVDDNRFYATLATQGSTHLVQGDITARTLRTLRANVECPSLSPDGTRLVFKKRIGADTDGSIWRLHLLDLTTMRETPLAEQRSVDDQALWQDNHTVLYSLPDKGSFTLWSVPADGTGTPHKSLANATSPALTR